MSTTIDLFFASYLDDLCSFAISDRSVPSAIARAAADTTLRALGKERDSWSLRTRARAYFWKTVRTLCRRSPDAAEARAYFLLAAVVADLERGGWGPGQVWEEIERGWADRVPDVVLQEYKHRLCA